MSTDYDLCVIGGGAAGLVVAAGAATHGAKVVLVEKQQLGGECLYTGCVPSKALLQVARVAHTVAGAAKFGVSVPIMERSLPAAMQWVRQVIAQIEPNDSPERFKQLGVEVINGTGRFISPSELSVNDRTLRARHFVIATGSRARLPDVEGLQSVPYLTNETIFSLDQSVADLIIVGGGPIGCELAQAFARLGTQVHLIMSRDQILPREDADLANQVAQSLSDDGVNLHLSSRTQSVSMDGERISLSATNGAGNRFTISADQLLIATGREPALAGLGLDAAGCATHPSGLQLDRRLRTSNRRIFACGDVAGPWLFTHMAEYQAGIVLRNTLFRLPAKFKPRSIPWCTFTDPELARVGLSETEAIAGKIPHRVYQFPFSELDRAITDGQTRGLVKLIATPRGRLLGAGIAGPAAGELIHEFSLALNKKMKLADISGLIHIYPTFSQANRRVADQRLKQGFTPRHRRWLQRLLRLRGEKLAIDTPVTGETS